MTSRASRRTAGNLEITEGASGTYTVVLDTEPVGDVTVAIVPPSGGDLTVDPPSLTFTTQNWDSARTVTVTAGHDSDKRNDVVTIVNEAAGADYLTSRHRALVAVTVIDDDKTVPGAPRGLSAVAGNAQVRLSWQRPADDGGHGITGYEVRVGSGGWTPTGSTATSYVVSGLTNSVTYAFAVRARNTLGPGAASNPVSAAPVPLVLTVHAEHTTVDEGSLRARFRVELSDPTDGAVFRYSITSTGVELASNNPRRVRYSGAGPLLVTVRLIDDDVIEPDGSVTLRLLAGDGYSVGSPRVAMVRVRDDDGGRGAGCAGRTGGFRRLGVVAAGPLADAD